MTLSFLDSHEDFSQFELKIKGRISAPAHVPVSELYEELRYPTTELAGLILRQIGKVDVDQDLYYSMGTPSVDDSGRTIIPLLVYYPKTGF